MILKGKKNNKTTLKSRIQKLLENSTLVVLVWAITIFLSSLITIYQGSKLLSEFYKNKIGIKKEMYSKLTMLKVNFHIDQFIKQLGKPTSIINSQTNQKEQYIEYLFVNEFYYLQVIVDSNQRVVSYAVTSRRRDFKPEFTMPFYQNKQRARVILNETTFSDIQSKINELKNDACHFRLGANRYYYFEEYYGGNPGNYQTSLIGINEAGYIEGQTIGHLFQEVENAPPEGNHCNHISSEFRKRSTFNTIIITAPFISYEELRNFSLGVNYLDVRVFE